MRTLSVHHGAIRGDFSDCAGSGAPVWGTGLEAWGDTANGAGSGSLRTTTDVPGQAITVIGEHGEHTFTVVNGFLDGDFQSGRGNERGTDPDLYISQHALKILSEETKIFRIAFDTVDSSYD